MLWMSRIKVAIYKSENIDVRVFVGLERNKDEKKIKNHKNQEWTFIWGKVQPPKNSTQHQRYLESSSSALLYN